MFHPRLFVFGALAFGLAGCQANMPVPANLTASGTELQLSSESEIFSRTVTYRAGDYSLVAKSDHKTEEESVRSDAVRTTKTVTWDIEFSDKGAGVLRGRCVDTFAWTQGEGTVFAEGVVDSFVCEGQTRAGALWKAELHRGDGNGYEGISSIEEQKFALRSLHAMVGDLQGTELGYGVYGADDEAHLAVRRVYSNQAGAVWLDDAAKSNASIVGTGIALILFAGNK